MKLTAVVITLLIIFELCWCHRPAYKGRRQKLKQPKALSERLKIYSTPQPKQELTIRIRIHFDKAVTQNIASKELKNTRRKIKSLAKKMLVDVEKIYDYPGLDQNIKFDLLDIRFLNNVTTKVQSDENLSKYLSSYCNWQSTKKTNQLFYSVLFTGLNGYYLKENGKQNRRSLGRSYKRSMCAAKFSCTIIKWKEKNIANMLAHEIAHSLGMSHDGKPSNNCDSKGTIMRAKFDFKKPPKIWSSCSRQDFKKYLESGKLWCLQPVRLT